MKMGYPLWNIPMTAKASCCLPIIENLIMVILLLGGQTKIIESTTNKDAITYTLENGLITHTSDNDGGDLANATFTYNANNQLVKLQYDEDEYTSYTWQGEKLTKIAWHEQYYDSANEFSYSGKPVKDIFR